MTKFKLFLTLSVIFLFGIISTSKAQEGSTDPADTLLATVTKMNSDISFLKRLKITGYMQPQYQHIDSAGAPSYAGGDFGTAASPYQSRVTMRRARFKFTYDYDIFRFLLNVDVTEKTLAMRETYIRVTDPWLKMFSLSAGCLQIPFGYELTYSSSERETPERARYIRFYFRQNAI